MTAVFMSLPDAVAIADENSALLIANASFLKLIGNSAPLVQGRSMSSLLSFMDGSATIAERAHDLDKRCEVSAHILPPGGKPVSVVATVVPILQPGFRPCFIILMRETKPADGAKRVVVAGKIQLIGLEEVKSALGTRWQRHADRVLGIAERIIRKRLQPHDVCVPTLDSSFVITFAEGTEEEASIRAAAIAREVRDRLIGESDDANRSAVTAVTRSIELGEDEPLDGADFHATLERRLGASHQAAERQACEGLQAAFQNATLDLKDAYDRTGRLVPIAYAALPKPLQERIDRAKAVLPPSKLLDFDFDALVLTLAGDVLLKNQHSGGPRALVVPVDYAICINKRRLDSYIRTCRALQEPVRRNIILLLSGIPSNVPQSRLNEIVRLFRPFARMIGIAPVDLDATPTDLIQSRIGMVVFPAASLAEWSLSTPFKLQKICERIRVSAVRLFAAHAKTLADAEFAKRLDVDFVCYDDDPKLLPKSPLFARYSKGSGRLRLSELPHAATIEASESGCVYVDATQPDRPIVAVNPAFLKLTGYTEQEILGKNCRFLQGPETDRDVVVRIRRALAQGQRSLSTFLNYRKDGTTFWNRLAIEPVYSDDGRLMLFVGVQTDVSPAMASETGRRRLLTLFESITQNIPGYVYQRVMRADGTIDFPFISRSYLKLVGAEPETQLAYSLMKERVFPEDLERVNREYLISAAALSPINAEIRLSRLDGEPRWLRIGGTPVRNAKGEVVWSGLAIDITAEKTVQGQLSYLTDYDQLTGVFNAARFRSDLTEYCDRTGEGDEIIALLLVELINFHEIKNAYGPTASDVLLKMAAERLIKALGPGPRIYHLNDNQFGILDVRPHAEDATAVQSIVHACMARSQPFEIGSEHVTTDVKVGICINERLWPDHWSAVDAAREWEKRANIALHQAKQDGRQHFSLYNAELDDRIRNRAILKQSMRRAVEQEEFEVYYQPIVDLVSGGIIGAEALLRWNHLTLGVLRPDQFIPLAEESGLIIPLGGWVLKTALDMLQSLQASGIVAPRIAVNVSGIQLAEGSLFQTVAGALAASGVDPGRLELELTESFMLNYNDEVLSTLTELRKLGVKIAIDDFGTGYSSFNYLRNLPIDKVKIDQVFVRNISANSSDITILRAMIEMGGNLGLEVVVEGIETVFHRNLLLDMGCMIGQGYFYSIPLPREDFLWLLNQNSPLPL